MKKDLKQQLYSLCLKNIEQRISNVQAVIDNAKESAIDETKGSSGDKHETGRAMAQLEQEKSSIQLNEVLEMKKAFERIDSTVSSQTIQVGSVVITDKGNFFISAPVGKLSFDDKVYFAISISSPIGVKIKNLSKNDSFEINGSVYKIVDAF